MSELDDGRYVFLSYSRKDLETATLLAKAIERQGIPVWWDRAIPAGVPFAKHIESNLKAAGCVIVLWSEVSTQSDWVRNEANWGAARKRLVPVRIESVDIPLEFQHLQTLDLVGWSGDEADRVFKDLELRLRDHLEIPTVDPPAASRPKTATSETSATPRARSAQSAPRTAAGRPMGRKLLPILAAAPLLLAVIWYGLTQWGQFGSEGGGGSASGGLAYTPLTGEGKTRSSDISPDGNYLVYAYEDDGQYSLKMKQIDTGSESVIVPGAKQGIRSPIFSPDGQFIYFAMMMPGYSMNHLAEYDLYRVSVLGGTPQRILSGVIGRRFDCAPTGDRVVFKRSVGDTLQIKTAGTDGSDERLIAAQPRDVTVRCCLAWSADGREVYTTIRDTLTGFLRILAVPVDGGSARPATAVQWQAVLDIGTLADDKGILIVGLPAEDQQELNINLWYLRIGSSELRRLTNDITYYYQVSADRTGSRMALTYYALKRALRVFPASDPSRYRDVSTDILSKGRVVWAAPGSLLANQRVGSRVGLVFLDLADRSIRQIPTDAEYVAGMALSPDRKRLVYSSFAGTDFTLWLAEGDGSAPHPLTDDEGNERFPVFSGDGNSVIYNHQAAVDKPYYIRRVSLDDGSVARLSAIPAMTPRISPDGTQIVASFHDEETGGVRPALIPVEGGDPQFLSMPEGFVILSWNPQGDGFTCVLRDGSTPNIWNVSIAGDDPRRLTDFPPGHRDIYDLSWNGTADSLAAVLEMTSFDAILLQGFTP